MATAKDYGAFIPTTNVWDVSQLYSIDVTKPEFKELLVRLYQNINNIANSVNIRDAGYYDLQEFVNGQLWFPNPALNSSSLTNPTYRQVLRTVINFGALPDAGPKSVDHNIVCSSKTTFTRIYATASDTTDLTYIPIPYASTTNLGAGVQDNIEIDVSSTQVTITTLSNRSNYNVCYVILEYIQS